MGYETQMIIVEKYSTMKQPNCIIDDKLHNCFQKDTTSPFIYYPDHNTETPVPPNTIIKKGDWCKIIATLDLAKTGISLPGLSTFEKSDGSFAYSPFDGNQVLGLDPYGEYRSFIPIDQAIDLIKKAIQEDAKKNHNQPYRRFTIALSLLESIKKEYLPHEGITQIGCLFWGH
jgi:hypothetical protein